MSDYISRQAAIDSIWDGTNYDIYTKEAKEHLEELPSADVRENVKGKWLKKNGSLWTLATCSVCGELSVEGNKPFCSNCGSYNG